VGTNSVGLAKESGVITTCKQEAITNATSSKYQMYFLLLKHLNKIYQLFKDNILDKNLGSLELPHIMLTKSKLKQGSRRRKRRMEG
jgi:hypothetical protein